MHIEMSDSEARALSLMMYDAAALLEMLDQISFEYRNDLNTNRAANLAGAIRNMRNVFGWEDVHRGDESGVNVQIQWPYTPEVLDSESEQT